MCLGIPGEVLTITDRNGLRMGDCRFAGVVREVCFDCLPEVQIGDFVLVHVGFAISKIDRELADHAYRTLTDIGMTSELTADRDDAAAPRAPAAETKEPTG